MKAQPVKKLDPERPLYENAARTVRTRLKELRAFEGPAVENGVMEAQHDMRIAAKRLRYVLEATELCFGSAAKTARRRTRDLQDILGELHDCDVMRPRVQEHVRDLREQDAEQVRLRAGGAPDLDPRLAARARHRTAYRGLDVLDVYLAARRKLLEERFFEFWREQESAGTWDRLDEEAGGLLDRAKASRRAAKRAQKARQELAIAQAAEREAAERAREAAERLESARRSSPRGSGASDGQSAPG
ncbi:MAG: CHAD domain-containing protein [Solirubrobacterales bacterium]